MLRTASLAAVSLILASTAAGGQQAPVQPLPRHGVYLEVAGSGGVGSLNYEYLAGERVRLRAGAGSWETDDLFGAGTESFMTVPLTASMLLGPGNHHLETGGGVLLGMSTFESAFGEPTRTSSIFALSGVLGYRYQRPRKGMLYRAVLVPFYGFGDSDTAYPDRGLMLSGGLSLGYAF